MYLNEYDLMKRLHKNPDEDGSIFISPIISKKQFGPGSFDLRLGSDFRILRKTQASELDLKSENLKKDLQKYSKEVTCYDFDNPFILHPDDFVLASSLEFISIPKDVVGILHGRSSWGRVGLLVHATAGFVDPGFSGHLTFELMNTGKLPIPLYPGLRIGQIGFVKSGENKEDDEYITTEIPYEGKYHFQFKAKQTSIYEDPEVQKVIQNNKNE